MLKIQRRHRAPCKKPMWDAGYTKCKCPIVIRGTLDGKHVTLSTARYLPPELSRSLEAAQELALAWQAAGHPVHPASTKQNAGEPELPTIERAVHAYLAQARDTGNGEAQLGKKRLWLGNRLMAFAQDRGIRYVSELNLTLLREWRATWNLGDVARSKIQGMVIGFLWDCERADLLPRNFASGITKGLGKIRVLRKQTGYFPPTEYQKIIDATWLYSDRPSIDKHNSFNRCGGDRIRAVTELMRWTGLRIRDAVTLERRRLSHDPATDIWSVMVYQRKTGDPVYCPIPPDVARMLLSVPVSQKGNTNETYFFWTGSGKPKTLVSNWERSYVKLFALANLKEADGKPKRCFPHMFRDTFAIENLLAGMRLEEVSMMLGHSSIKVTEEHYMPWVHARQKSLNQAVLSSWTAQGKLPQPKTVGRAGKGNAVIPISSAG